MHALTRPSANPAVSLRQLAADLGLSLVPATTSTAVSGIALDSRRIRPGDLFAALPGEHVHGATFIEEAARAGAKAVLTDAEGVDAAAHHQLPCLLVGQPRAVIGAVAAAIYHHPDTDLAVIGVTGTQGKTTTTRLLEAACRQAGVATGVVGTVGATIMGQELPSTLTTPEAPALQGLMARMVEVGVELCALEVSSHALALGRVDGITFDSAVFLNLGRDHLDFHRSMDDYFATKASLFDPERCRRAVISIDDEYGRRLRELLQLETHTVSLADPSADWWVEQLKMTSAGSRAQIRGPDGLGFTLELPLPGRFNVANAVCGLAAIAQLGVDPLLIAQQMASTNPIPGRLERIDVGQPFTAFVDYAHKPDAIAAMLATVRTLTSQRVLIVLGAGGDRDQGKRTEMGRVAALGADVVVVTDDNPRSEDPAHIRQQILAGTGWQKRSDLTVVEIADRRQAIEHVVNQAEPGDVVVIAGKGHETGQEIGSGAARRVLPFDDRLVLRAALEELQ